MSELCHHHNKVMSHIWFNKSFVWTWQSQLYRLHQPESWNSIESCPEDPLITNKCRAMLEINALQIWMSSLYCSKQYKVNVPSSIFTATSPPLPSPSPSSNCSILICWFFPAEEQLGQPENWWIEKNEGTHGIRPGRKFERFLPHLYIHMWSHAPNHARGHAPIVRGVVRILHL